MNDRSLILHDPPIRREKRVLFRAIRRQSKVKVDSTDFWDRGIT